ncbi:MAG: MCE family protein [Cyclobacteriaceae bacterium]|nr:MCE family protein [Cyclobacteriaceae bacterium]
MNATKTINNMKLGLFVFAGLLFLIFSLYMIGRNRSLFGSTFTITARFNNINGLVPGNNVRYSGIDVGTVNRIELINDTSVLVTMLIDKSARGHIKTNALASIGTDGLMGNKLVSIKSQAGDAPLVNDGDEILTRKPVETDEMLQTLNTTNENIAIITTNLKEITAKLNSRNSLWTMLSDTMIVQDMKKAVGSIRQAGANTVRFTEDAAALVHTLETGKGIANSLFTDTLLTRQLSTSIREIQKASQDLSQTTSQLKETIEKASHGQGAVGVLLSDTATANNLRRTMKNVEQGTSRFNENMEAMKHNWLFKGYFKDQEKKAEQEKKEQQKKTSQEKKNP